MDKQILDVTHLWEEYKRLEQENAELKKRQVTKNGFICDCEQNVKYRQALEEIRGIAEKRNYLNLDEALDDILDKINEVLGND